MIPFSQIISRVRTQHEAESTVRWSDRAIGLAINEGLEDFSEVTRFYERHVTVPVVNLRNYYDIRGFLPETALGVTSVWSSLTEDWLVPVDPLDLGSRWEHATGPPRRVFMRGLFWMVVYPKPETTAGFLRVYFQGHAPYFTHSQAVLRDLIDDYVPSLEEYALYDLAAQDGETTRALLHWNAYIAKTKEIANFVERRTVKARVLKMGSR